MARRIPVREFEYAVVEVGEVIRGGRFDVFPEVANKDLFQLDLTAEAARIQARGYVGLIPVNESITLEVTPRVPIGNLSRLLELSGEQPQHLIGVLRGYETAGTMYPSLVALYAEALLLAVSEIVGHGFLKEYQRREAVSSMPHGRILVGGSLQQAAAGRSHKVAISWHQRSIDNPANQCLLYATHSLAAYAAAQAKVLGVAVANQVARQLNQCSQLLQGVSLDHQRRFLDDPLVQGRRALPTLRGQYRSALDLALAIVHGRAITIEDAGEALRLPSLLLNMSTVFESYLRAVLTRISEQEEWPVKVLDGNVKPGAKGLLDTGQSIEANPDIVTMAGQGQHISCPVIVEVKYKPAKKRPKRADLEQSVMYGLSYRSAHLVVAQPHDPTGYPPGLHEIGSLRGTRIWMYVFDLSAADLGDAERSFTAGVLSLVEDALVAGPVAG